MSSARREKSRRGDSPPSSRLDREPGVCSHRKSGHSSKVPSEVPGLLKSQHRVSFEENRRDEKRDASTHQNPANHRDLESGRDDVEQDRGEDEGDSSSDRKYEQGSRKKSAHSAPSPTNTSSLPFPRSPQFEHQKRRDPLGSPIDSPRQPTRLPRQMELEIHSQQMLERFPRDLPNRALSDGGEDGVSEL